MIRLGINIDHVATVRQARKTFEPDPVEAATMAERGGADQITAHLRADRRHIQDYDIEALSAAVQVKFNFECASEEEMLSIACRLKPDQVCLVPENRQEITTEGGLDVVTHRDTIARSVDRLQQNGIFVSLFVDPETTQIAAAAELGVEAVELHTGAYSNAQTAEQLQQELAKLEVASAQVAASPLRLHAGHGLNYSNVQPVARIAELEELNIGHSVIARSISVGMESAVREMKQLISLAVT
ncbi:MAG: pyridoxine 5'-phosphate synthase [Mariniblastus sp.]|nr:pyridoxine 5'-phosphate synthase [Mariniblastus sp.]